MSDKNSTTRNLKDKRGFLDVVDEFNFQGEHCDAVLALIASVCRRNDVLVETKSIGDGAELARDCLKAMQGLVEELQAMHYTTAKECAQ